MTINTAVRVAVLAGTVVVASIAAKALFDGVKGWFAATNIVNDLP